MKIKTIFLKLPFLALLAIILGCSGSTIRGTSISSEKNFWLEESEGGGVDYCMANVEGNRADPVCFKARRAKPHETMRDQPLSSGPVGFSPPPTSSPSVIVK